MGQPLSSKKDSGKGTGSDDVTVIYKPTRKRLSKKRRSQTISFSVAGAEGYMTAGEYDDGSIGLQYDVRWRAFVSTYINMRFDPAGMTDDADIRIAQSVMD